MTGDHAMDGGPAAWPRVAVNMSVSTAAAVAAVAPIIRINPSVFIGVFIVVFIGEELCEMTAAAKSWINCCESARGADLG